MRKAGFSLIELLIVMGFITVISLTVTTVYVVGIKTYNQELASSSVQSDSQTILDALTTDIKNGVSIDLSYDTYTTDTDTIIIRVPAISSSKDVLYTGTNMRYDYIIYDYSGNDIHKIVYADPSSKRYGQNGRDNILDRNILSLSFDYDPTPDSATLVTVNISSNIKMGNEERNISLTGQARLRNHI